MSDSHMHEAHASSAEAEASFSAPSDAAAPDFLRFEPPAELIEAAPLVSSSLGSSLGRTRRLRRDGWTAAARRAFLERLAETGVVLDACLAAGMSAQAAYALAARDSLFHTLARKTRPVINFINLSTVLEEHVARPPLKQAPARS